MLQVRDHILRTSVLEQRFSAESDFAPPPRGHLSMNAAISGRVLRVPGMPQSILQCMRQPSLPTTKNYLAPNNNCAEIENPQPGVDSGLEAAGDAMPGLLVGVVVGA